MANALEHQARQSAWPLTAAPPAPSKVSPRSPATPCAAAWTSRWPQHPGWTQRGHFCFGLTWQMTS